MLQEIKDVAQIPGEKRRRWFASPNFDLFVFFDKDEIVEFQLSYNKRDKEKIVIWTKDNGFSHQAVDDGDHPGKIKRSPIIIPDGIFSKNKVLEDFTREAKNIDKKIADFVKEKLNSC
ncbi:MAG: hypothetical protein N2258_02810 [Brevinematales bacterium]|nr:hypothetical protein [Brevinematales bacterium]